MGASRPRGEQAWQRPRLRPVEVLPTVVEGQQLYLLRDHVEPEGPALLVSAEGLLLLSFMDGERDLAGVRAAFALRTGQMLSAAQVEAFVRGLDETYLLVGARHDRRLEALRATFRTAPRRAAIHAGGAYPGDAAALEAALDAHFATLDRRDAPRNGGSGRELVGLIAPHVDLHRGGPTYAWAYQALAEAVSPELVVLLGTCHAPLDTAFAATTKDYDTPFGPLPTDAAFVRDLAADYSADLLVDEFAHRAEHALEFQAVYLRYLQRRGQLGPVQAVPILCGSPHGHVPPGASPADTPVVAEFLALLAERLAADGRRTLLIAGADLAHVGPQFGDPRPLTGPMLRRVEREDTAMLVLASAPDAEGFYRDVMDGGDRRRICGIAPMYSLLQLLPPARGELLRYAQWADPDGQAAVTFASVAYYRA